MFGRNGGLCGRPPLGPGVADARASAKADASTVRQTLREAQKNDAADAEAICEAVTRPNMRLVEIKSCEQQGVLVLHRIRLMLMHQRIALSNATRGHMAEYGLVAPVGRNGLQRLIEIIADESDGQLPQRPGAP
jgi:transposase